ncbi:hypothetical protein [Tenacibaculum phage JQ]|nr:hypothetical protein [Tenacibaculum phage JQ]
MRLIVVNRRYLLRGKFFRYNRMKGVKDLGFKFAIGIYEFRFYR